MIFKKILSGYYKAQGIRGEYKIERMDSGMWYLTYPGCRGPDDMYHTLRDARSDAEIFDRDEDEDLTSDRFAACLLESLRSGTISETLSSRIYEACSESTVWPETDGIAVALADGSKFSISIRKI